MEMVSLISLYLEIPRDLVGHFEWRHLLKLITIAVAVYGLAPSGDTAMT